MTYAPYRDVDRDFFFTYFVSIVIWCFFFLILERWQPGKLLHDLFRAAIFPLCSSTSSRFIFFTPNYSLFCCARFVCRRAMNFTSFWQNWCSLVV